MMHAIPPNCPTGYRTTDPEIASIADDEGRVVVTKDRDFRDSHLLRGVPRRLLIVTTGNISNNDLWRSSMRISRRSWARSKRCGSSNSARGGSSSTTIATDSRNANHRTSLARTPLARSAARVPTQELRNWSLGGL